MLPNFQHWSNQAHPAQFQLLYAYRHRVWTKVILPQHDASVGVQSSSGALKHLALKCKSEMFNCVLPINSHTRHDAFAEINQPVVLSSIHIPILGRV